MSNKLVLQTDFGLVDGAVAAMYGVAYGVDEDLSVHDLTHEIPPYDIFAASYRLYQTTKYWPVGTVFVSVVDPGVGSDRRSIAVETTDGHFIITPDNGTLTHLDRYVGIRRAVQIDEVTSALPGSQESHTFHGRDVYAYNGARLASGQIKLEDLGKPLAIGELVRLPLGNVTTTAEQISGTIDILDIRFGSLWTNISSAAARAAGIAAGDQVQVTIRNNGKLRYQNQIPFTRTFAAVSEGEPLVYVNSLLNLGVAINQDSFSKLYHIGTGVDWQITFKKID
ncbi:SAM hydrolase/SAM-dependent halogenase family protein [Lacticaseibacillus kribbianus]|uniref:SAM hydrolase/SAM-dependent halogenase family protein n=1 Tax=Lacticaseibacillus kribbianus TaxID=2926292 RepID=UPI001CD77F48